MAVHQYTKKENHRALDGKVVVKLFTQDGARELLIPSGKPNFYPVVLSQDRLHQLQEKAAKKQPIDAVKERERLAKLSQERKAKFRSLDTRVAKKSSKLTDLDEEAKEKANYLLKRAWELRMEQEDDIKAANSLILKTKCQAIRDAQLAEQTLVKKKLRDDERHIEMEMEKERINKIIEEKRNLELKQCKKEVYVKELSKQMEENNSKKLMEFEKIIQERRHLNEAMNIMMLDEIRKQREAEAAKEKTRKDLARTNDQILRAQRIAKEEARIEDLKVQEWMRQRAEREEAIERELAEARKKKELEIARLRAMQEKAGELQELQDQMMAVRRQEEYEREWRRKEKEAALKKKERNEKLLEVRQKQVDETKRIQAQELVRERREFEKIMQAMQEEEGKERAKETVRNLARAQYRENLLQQMNQKEAELIKLRGEELAEGVAMRAEAARREDEVRRFLRSKVEQMRAHKVPEMYVGDIMRQLHLNDEQS